MSDDRSTGNMVVGAAVISILAAIAYFIYMGFKPPPGNGGTPEDTQTLSLAREVNNDPLSGTDTNPGTRDVSIHRGPPLFTSGVKNGYRCLRCSDSGANDGDQGQFKKNPRVAYMCPTGASMAWPRADAFTRSQLSARIQPGNFIIATPASSTEDPGLAGLSGIALCSRLCDTMPSDAGTCVAANYNSTKNQCEFFYNCDKVEADPDSAMYLKDYSKYAQPEVVNKDY